MLVVGFIKKSSRKVVLSQLEWHLNEKQSQLNKVNIVARLLVAYFLLVIQPLMLSRQSGATFLWESFSIEYNSRGRVKIKKIHTEFFPYNVVFVKCFILLSLNDFLFPFQFVFYVFYVVSAMIICVWCCEKRIYFGVNRKLLCII